ncbi:stage III sporulation protein AG [Crassaminicella profunda]|uniref:stage III sporulation protein AG n=1 Tax=Crassaminicella profunda TaxID=1286698 RepID=UPI001CA65C2D|nr:stage III sporulation protein AG [Crassaminicella profunda]QZY56964.1 stage III sporulation protein AG [Crassaminicella profunda]
MKILDKFKEYISSKGYKKIVYNLLVIVIICTIALITWDSFFPVKIKTSNSIIKNNPTNEETVFENEYEDSDEIKLKKILSNMKGVGDVDVMITYETSTEVVPALNVTKSSQITEEKDAQGGVRTTTQDDLNQNVIMANQNEQLVVIKEIKPQIRGVVIVATGASDIKIKTELIEAAQTLFQIPAHKVMVYEKK